MIFCLFQYKTSSSSLKQIIANLDIHLSLHRRAYVAFSYILYEQCMKTYGNINVSPLMAFEDPNKLTKREFA